MKEHYFTQQIAVEIYSLEAVLSTAFQEGLPIAVWRLPQHETFHLIVGLKTLSLSKPNLEELQKGFIISPFLQKEQQGIHFIPADLHFQFSSGNSDNLQLQKSTLLLDDNGKKEAFLKKVTKNKIKSSSNFFTQDITEEPINKESFIQMVDNAIDAMHHNQFKKVVLSRMKKSPLNKSFNLADSFLRLSNKYPHAFVSLVSTPETGTWIGATPEILVEVEKNQYFKTMALAGTQALRNEEDLREITWKQKEIEEQAMVSRYIINCFKKIRLREFDEIGPRTVSAAKLVHLRTDYIVNLRDTNFPELGSVMLELLHPTSAVCGMPKAPALDFIQEHEGYNRSLYSGYLGPVQVEESTNIFVNLRCVQLTHKEVIYYAGAGITIDSIAEKEWEETALKMGTVAACL